MKRSLTLLFGLSLGAFAQEPPAPGSVLPQPGIPEPLPSLVSDRPAPPAFNLGRSLRSVDPNELRVAAGDKINEANITALAAAQIYEENSGKRVIMSNAVAQSEVSFTMSGPLTRRDIAKLLKLTLLGEGLAMIPIPDEPDIVRLVPSGPITSVSGVPKDVFLDEYSLPVDDQIVTYRMSLRYLKPDEAVRYIQAAMGQLSASGNITAVPNASALIITENSSLIRQMIKVKNIIDVPTAVGEKWVTVTYGDVDEIAEQMNEIYNEQGSSQTATRTTRAGAPPSPGSTPGAATSGEEIPIKIISVRRTSRILLVGRPADLIAAEAMVKSFDQPSTDNNRKIFRLRYLRVGDFMTIAENAINATLGESAAGAQGGGRNNANQNNNNNNTGQQGADGGNRASIEEQDIPTAPDSVLVGRTHLVADNVANTIIVNGPPHHIELVRDLIADLDSESQQVALSAVVGSYALGKNLNFGIDLARAVTNAGGNFQAGGLTNFTNGIIDPRGLSDLGEFLTATGGGGDGLSFYGAIGDSFGVFVNALESTTRFKTLERTVLTTRNNRVAELSSGQRIAIPTSTFQGGTTGNTTNIEFRDVTLDLQIQPLINSNNQITLEISIVRDSIGLPRDVGTDLSVPDINTESLTTSVTVQDGSAVILGGIITTTDNNSKSGIPILSNIPGIGKLFGSTNNDATQSELIIMIQPRIIDSQPEFDGFRHDYGKNSNHSNEVVEAFSKTRGNQQQVSQPQYAEPQNEVEPARNSTSNSRSSKSKIRRRTGSPGR